MKMIRCIDAKEPGIPLIEGRTYTVESEFIGAQSKAEATIPGMENTPGYTLSEVPGYFRADRFVTIAPDSR